MITLLTLATLLTRKAETEKLQNSVQTAVYNLAISGNMIETGKFSKRVRAQSVRCDGTGALNEVSDLMKAGWVAEFDAAANELSVGISGAQDNAQEIVNGISSLQSTAANGINHNQSHTFQIV